MHNLRKGKHAYKFIVDDEWRFAPDQPTVADIEGRINNFVDVSDFKAYTGEDDITSHRSRAALPPAQADEAYTQSIPDLDEYSKEPPPLPPHLRHIILNKAPVVSDACALPVPHHVALNHLYCTAIKARARARARARSGRDAGARARLFLRALSPPRRRRTA